VVSRVCGRSKPTRHNAHFVAKKLAFVLSRCDCMRAMRVTRPPWTETTRKVRPSSAIDPDPPGSMEKKSQRSSPDHPTSTIGPGVSPGPMFL